MPIGEYFLMVFPFFLLISRSSLWTQRVADIISHPVGSLFTLCVCLVAQSFSTVLWPPWTVACQVPLSLGFPRQEYWGGLPFPSPGDFPDSGIKPESPVSPALQADSLPAESLGKSPFTHYGAAAAAAKSLQSCPTLCDPLNWSLPGSSIHGVFWARVLEWGAIAFSDDPPPRVMEINTKVNKWDLIKLKIFCTAKETISKVKRQPSELEKIIANETTDKRLISKIYKHLIQQNTRNQTNKKQPNQKLGKRHKCKTINYKSHRGT